MTLVEIVVATTVFAVGVLAIFRMTDASFKTATGTTHRARATAVATKAIESARSLPFEQLVVQPPGTVVSPTPETVGGSTFNVYRTVEAVSGVGYKKVNVTVEWADGAGGHDITQSTYVYPSGTQTTTTTLGVTGAPLAPVLNTITQADGTVRINWTKPTTGDPVKRWVVQKALNNMFTGVVWDVTDEEPPSSSSYLVSGLAGGTTYFFRVGAVGANGLTTWSTNSLSTTTSISSDVSCKVASTSVTPGTVERVSSYPSALAVTPTITAETTGTCTGLKATYELPDGSTSTIPLVPTVGKVWTASITNNGSIKWQVGDYEVTVEDNLTERKGTTSLIVCDPGAQCG